ncbi:hypothetical protein DUI87_22996 [Hirundo rustica rustica]|uniref:Uncharacterized protein n=1 Tax=Hirundo rustica rustica TaxID=333673 RepID=A0A3M0JGX3_HIRRU|nr:hypothetical protein DUI87_22996 [Hirundo rustica rustica]
MLPLLLVLLLGCGRSLGLLRRRMVVVMVVMVVVMGVVAVVVAVAAVVVVALDGFGHQAVYAKGGFRQHFHFLPISHVQHHTLV